MALFSGLLLAAASGCARVGLATLNGLASLGDYERHSDLQYGPDELNGLDVYQPKNLETAAPVILFWYGGCWGGCQTYTREHYKFVGDTLASAGYVVVIPDYRRHPEVRFGEIMTDAAAAFEWTTNNIEQYDGDASKIYLAGHSAGGHIAVTLGIDERRLTDEQRKHVVGLIGLAAPYDWKFDTDYHYQLFGPEENYPDAQPIRFVDGSEPPMLLQWGLDDTTVYPRNIDNMETRLNTVGSKVTAKRYADVDHIGILTAFARPFRNRKPIVSDIRAFIDSE